MGSHVSLGAGARTSVIAVLQDPDDALGLSRAIACPVELAGLESGGVLRKILSDESIAAVLVDIEAEGTASLAMLADVAAHRPSVRRVVRVIGADPSWLDDAIGSGTIDYVLRPGQSRAELGRALQLLVESFENERASQALVSTLRRLSSAQPADASAVLAELERIGRGVELAGLFDPETGLYNGRCFRERLREEVARARRYRKHLTLVYADIDDLSMINRELGRGAGDAMIGTLAQLLREGDGAIGNRECDIPARLGGQKFAILLPETDKAGGEIKAERLRQALAQSRVNVGRVTASFGVASFPADAGGAAELLEAAISAQREAKRAGKNRIARAEVLDGDPIAGAQRKHFTYYHGHLGEITAALVRDLSVSCLFVDLSQLRRVERELGVDAHATLFARAGELLADKRGACLRRDDSLFRTEDADGYLCFLAPARDTGPSAVPLDLVAIADRVQRYLEDHLSADIAKLIREPARFVVGYARVLANPMIRSERLVLKVIADARASALLARQRNSVRDMAELQDLIVRHQLRAVYQPIVELESGDLFGFEALTRGPEGTALESPSMLFSIADEVDLLFELDRACFRGGLRGAAGLSPVHRLFVNVLPQSFYDTRFIEDEVARLLDGASLTPANVVFEITERLAIENFTAFRQALATYTAMGFGVAIDDVGTRHSNLETVMALRPHFIKVSDVLTRGVSRSTVKLEMLRSLQRIASTIDAVVVAEGIEQLDDVEALADAGVRYGQGYYLARPGPAFPELPLERRNQIRAVHAVNGETASQLTAADDEWESTTVLARGTRENVKVARSQFARGSKPSTSEQARHAGDQTTPQLLVANPRPWQPLSLEELGRSREESSLLDALRDDRESLSTDPDRDRD